MLSWWEKQSLLNYDLIIVGSGIVGLSTAISYKEKKKNSRVLVLERGILPTGASTKNAGFACIGSLTEILDDLAHMSQSEVYALVELRLKGLQRLRKRLGDERIDYREDGSFELISHVEHESLHSLERANDLLKPMLKGPAFSMCDEKIEAFGFERSYTQHLVSNNYEGQLDTGKMMRALIDLCLTHGIEIKTGCEVTGVGQGFVNARHTVLDEVVTFTAPKVAVCTNAFSRVLLPELDIQPGRGQVLVTKPIEGLKFKGIFHFDKGYYYFRRLGERVLFGGGRNLDFEGERTTAFEANQKIRASLVEKLQTIILPGQTFEVQDWWTGIMAFGETKFPIVKQIDAQTFVAARMGGMGVAIGSEVGEQLALMMAESE